jgi:hypothetical protein
LNALKRILISNGEKREAKNTSIFVRIAWPYSSYDPSSNSFFPLKFNWARSGLKEFHWNPSRHCPAKLDRVWECVIKFHNQSSPRGTIVLPQLLFVASYILSSLYFRFFNTGYIIL